MRKPIPELEMELVDIRPGFLCRRCARCCADKLIVLYERDLERLRGIGHRVYEDTTQEERKLTGASHKMMMVKRKCILLEKDFCRYYDLRPDTCRRHPFLETDQHTLVASTCPGVNWLEKGDISDNKELSCGMAKSIDAYLSRRDG